MGALAKMDFVGGLAHAFYILGIAGVIALGLLSVWVVLSPSFKKA